MSGSAPKLADSSELVNQLKIQERTPRTPQRQAFSDVSLKPSMVRNPIPTASQIQANSKPQRPMPVMQLPIKPIAKHVTSEPINTARLHKVLTPKAKKRSNLQQLKRRSTTVLTVLVIGLTFYAALDTINTNRQVRSGNTVHAQAPTSDGDLDESEPTTDPLAGYTVTNDLPRALFIPTLDIRAKIERVGTTKDNQMAVPRSIDNVGWYEGAAKPDETGAIVLDGHVSGKKRPGVFKHIGNLQTGDEIVVQRGDLSDITYRVHAVETIKVADLDMKKLVTAGQSSKELHLITCGGNFDAGTQTYDSRTIVYASQVQL